MAIPERPDPEIEELMAGGKLKMKASFDSPSFSDEQIMEIGAFLHSLDIKSMQYETADRRINKLTAAGPGYEIRIFSGIMGQSIDVVLEDEDLVRCSWVEEKRMLDVGTAVTDFGQGTGYRQNVDLMMEKIRFMAYRHQSLVAMGYEKSNGNTVKKGDESMRFGVHYGLSEVYTKPVPTLHVETVKRELQKIFDGLS